MAVIRTDNFNDLSPAPPAGFANVRWQADPESANPRRVSAYVPNGGGSGAGIVVNEIALAPSAPGNFTVPHGLTTPPAFVVIQMDSGGAIWFQSPLRYDATNLYLVASDAGVIGKAECWMATADAEIALAPSAPGNFAIAHGLGVKPALILLAMTSGGVIWAQDPDADATNLHLTASDSGVTGFAECFKVTPLVQVISFQELALAPGAPGNFTVAHSLSRIPRLAAIRTTSGGEIWFQNPTRYDASNLYLVASDAGVTGYADVWA